MVMGMVYLFFWSFLSLGVGLREGEGEEEVLCLRRRLWEGERRLKQQRKSVKVRKEKKWKRIRRWIGTWKFESGDEKREKENIFFCEKENVKHSVPFLNFQSSSTPHPIHYSVTVCINSKPYSYQCSPIFLFLLGTTHQISM